eukprot:1749182-Rhodomonas_salina.2
MSVQHLERWKRVDDAQTIVELIRNRIPGHVCTARTRQCWVHPVDEKIETQIAVIHDGVPWCWRFQLDQQGTKQPAGISESELGHTKSIEMVQVFHHRQCC